jgi:hypothetical protein
MNCTTLTHLLLVAPALLAGCGSLADSDYQGEGLMRIDGSIVSGESNLPPMEVALLWQISPDAQGCDRASDGVARVTTEGMFPAAFRLVITQPPPAAAFVGDSPVAEAYVAALDKQNRVYGYAANAGKVVYKVIYARRDIAANSADSARLGGTALRAGYQLAVWDLSGSSPTAVLRLAGERENVSIEILTTTGSPVQPVCGGPLSPGTAPGPTTPSPSN